MTKLETLIAASLRNSKARIDEAANQDFTTPLARARSDAWDTVCEDMAHALTRANTALDQEQFLLACCDTVADRNRLCAA